MCDLQWELLAEISLKENEWPEKSRCLCSRLFTNTQGYRNKTAGKENGEDVNTSDNGEATEKNISTKVEIHSGADFLDPIQGPEAKWHQYWSQNGERLIWDSWIEKYSAYIKPEYLQVQSASLDGEDSVEDPKDNIENTSLRSQALYSVPTNNSRQYSENTDSHKSNFTTSESETVKSLGQLNLNSSTDEALVSDESGEYEVNADLNAEMSAMGLPSSFSSSSERRKDTNIKKKTTSIPARSDSFNAGRNKVRAAFNLIGMEFKDEAGPMTGCVDYKMKHIRLQNQCIQIYDSKAPKHSFFDEDGNVIAVETKPNEENIYPSESDDYEYYDEEEAVTDQIDKEPTVPKKKKKQKKKRKVELPPEVMENPNLKKYWRRRFDLFSKFDQGIRLDQESWYSVTPEQMAKFTAEKCKCNVIIDACCGAGGNTIQFAMTCEKVISMDIDPLKIEMAKHNAAIYGVADKIEFIVGDFVKLAPTLEADVLFMSPPWGGPDYINQQVYDLETMLLPIPLSELLVIGRRITPNIALFLPKNSNTHQIIEGAGPGGKVEIQQEFLNKKLIAITAYYGNLVKET